MSEYTSDIVDAVSNAMKLAGEMQDNMDIDAINHLMAQKREFSDGETSWVVRMSDSFDSDWMTHLFDDISYCAGSAEDVAKRIEQCWDEDWTEIQRENPRGDFSLGSSDFVARSALADY